MSKKLLIGRKALMEFGLAALRPVNEQDKSSPLSPANSAFYRTPGFGSAMKAYKKTPSGQAYIGRESSGLIFGNPTPTDRANFNQEIGRLRTGRLEGPDFITSTPRANAQMQRDMYSSGFEALRNTLSGR